MRHKGKLSNALNKKHLIGIIYGMIILCYMFFM